MDKLQIIERAIIGRNGCCMVSEDDGTSSSDRRAIERRKPVNVPIWGRSGSNPPNSPELNPKENLWDEIRKKIFKNYALKSMDAVCAKLKQAVLYIERNPARPLHHRLPLYRQLTLI